jgi:hypothetical protein
MSGTLILILSVYLISQGKVSITTSEEDLRMGATEIEIKRKEKVMNSMMALIMAFISIIFFTFRDYLLRYYKVYKNYPASELSLDSLTLYSFCCVVFSVVYFGFLDHSFVMEHFYNGMMSAVLNTTGFMLLGISIVIGYAGPANALNSIQAVILTLISASVLH